MEIAKKAGKKYLLLRIFAIVLIAIFAFLLRSNLYIHHDFNFFLDQARDMNLTKEIAVNHKLPLIGARSGLGGIFHGPLWLYMITPFFLVSGGDPFWTLVPLFLLISIGIVIGGYFVGKKLYGETTGLLFALILAFNPLLLAGNLGTTNAQVMPLIFLLYLFGIIQFMRGRNSYFIMSVLAIGLGFHFESAFSVFLIPLTGVAMLLRKSIPDMKNVLISIGVFFLTVSNFIFFELRHQFLMTHAALGLLQGKVEPLKGYEHYADIGFRVQDRAQLLYNYFFDPLFQLNIFLGWVLIALLITATVLIFWKKKKSPDQREFAKEYLFILLIPFLYFSIYVLYPMPLWSHYILPLVITAVFLLVLALTKLTMYTYGRYVVGIFLIFLSLPAFSWIQQAYFISQAYTPVIDGSFLNQKAVVDKIYADVKKSEFGYFEYSPAVLTYNMDYLIWWENKKHNLAVSNTKKPLTYLIMYPAPGGDQGAYDFWKKNVLRTKGKVLSRWIMNGGIIVEKLQIPPGEPEVDPNYYQNLLFR